MSLETEAKFHVDSHNFVRQRLEAVGATFLEKVLERNWIFDRPDGLLRAQGCGLRVRLARGVEDQTVRSTLTFKGPSKNSRFKQREEIEVLISDAESAVHMLDQLGFTVILQYDKRRESWSWRKCRIELDEPPHIGRFVEIEGPDELAIEEVRTELGLSDVPHVQASYVRLLLAYCHENGLTNRVLFLT